MTKNEAMKLSEKCGMQFMREPITNLGTGVYVKLEKCIPELDKLVEQSAKDDALKPCYVSAEYLAGGDLEAVYKLVVPAAWIDLWGWA